MGSTKEILICDRDKLFRESLRNFLLMAGYSRITVTQNLPEELVKPDGVPFDYILIGIHAPFFQISELANRLSQPRVQSKIFFLILASEQHLFPNSSLNILIKEKIYESILELI